MSERVEVIGARPDAEGSGLPRTAPPGWSPGVAWRRMMTNSFLRHNLLLFVGNMSVSALTFLFHPIIGHLLGNERYGTVVSFGAFTLVLSLPATVIPSVFNKFTADLIAQGRTDQVNYLLRRGTYCLVIMGVIAAVLFAVATPFLVSVFKVPPQYALITSLSFVIAFAAPLTLGALQGRQQFAWFSLLNFLGAFLRVVFTALLLLKGLGLNGTLIATLLSTVVAYVLSFVPLRDIFRGSEARPASLKPLFSYSLGATLALGASTLLSNTDQTLAAPFLSLHDASYYDAIATTGKIVLFVGGSFVLAMFPKVATRHQQGLPHGELLAWTIAGVCTLSASVVFVFALFPSHVINIILPHTPATVAQNLPWYGLAMLLLEAASVLMGYFMALGRMSFVPILVVCWGLQVALFAVWHGSIAQMVAVMVVVMAVLLAGLIGFYFLRVASTNHNVGAETERALS